jgi:tetratricopeptide (TPR) repeat protein
LPLFRLPCPIRNTASQKQIFIARLARPPQSEYNTTFHTMTQTQKSRREMLEQFLAAKPDDAFARYGLALECAKLGDDTAANNHFTKLLHEHPSYVAGYLQFGQLLARLGRLDEARKTLSDGIVIAQKAGDIHARDEMQSALTQLR